MIIMIDVETRFILFSTNPSNFLVNLLVRERAWGMEGGGGHTFNTPLQVIEEHTRTRTLTSSFWLTGQARSPLRTRFEGPAQTVFFPFDLTINWEFSFRFPFVGS